MRAKEIFFIIFLIILACKLRTVKPIVDPPKGAFDIKMKHFLSGVTEVKYKIREEYLSLKIKEYYDGKLKKLGFKDHFGGNFGCSKEWSFYTEGKGKPVYLSYYWSWINWQRGKEIVIELKHIRFSPFEKPALQYVYYWEFPAMEVISVRKR